FGVGPERVVDVQALAGDSIDNVPGAPGIGVKTAAQLIEEYGDLESLLARAAEIKQPKRRQTLIDHAEQIRISKRLVELDCRMALDFSLESLEIREPDPEALLDFLTRMELRTLTKRVAERFGTEAPTLAEVAAPAAAAADAEPAVPAAALPAIDRGLYVTIRDEAVLAAWLAEIAETG